MSLAESIRMALRSLRANKMRSGLTMLGIIIGTGAVIALLSAGQGVQAAITEQIQGIGANLIMVYSSRPETPEGVTSPIRRWLTRQDAEAIADPNRTTHVAGAAPMISRSATVTYGGESVDTQLVGTTPDFEWVNNFRAEYGSFFSAGEDSAGARVAVLGTETAEELFGEATLSLEETVRINRVPFRVIGILEKKGGQGGMFGGGSQDNLVIVPLSTAQQRFYREGTGSQLGDRVDMINVSAVDQDSIEAAIEEITWVLREEHDIEYNEDDFSLTSQEEILSALGQVTNILTIFLGSIAGISLLVGGIGIMNIMLVSVTERTREIGLRKAVGAKRSAILWQFLIESIVLSVIGGLVGIGFGWAIAAVVNTLDAFTTYVSPQAVTLAVGFSIAVGVFFGIYPASRASNLSPIDALRYE